MKKAWYSSGKTTLMLKEEFFFRDNLRWSGGRFFFALGSRRSALVSARRLSSSAQVHVSEIVVSPQVKWVAHCLLLHDFDSGSLSIVSFIRSFTVSLGPFPFPRPATNAVLSPPIR